MHKFIKIFFIGLIFATHCFSEDLVIDLDKLSLQANKENKHTLVFFHMTYCPYCKKMDKFTFNNKDIKKKVDKNFLFVDMNVDDDDIVKYKDFKDTKREFAKNLAISFYPTILFIDENNEIAYVVKGYRTKDKFNIILDYMRTKSYLDMDLAGYLDELEFKD